MDAHTLTHNLGGFWRNGQGKAPCPVCQPERRRDQTALSILEKGGRLLVYCHKNRCSFVEIANAAQMPLESVHIDMEAQRKIEQRQAEYQAAKLVKARTLWGVAQPITGTKAEIYLRARGITAPLPPTLRFMPDLFHAPTTSWAMAMIADVQTTGGVHRTFFDKQGQRLTKGGKMMLGPCAGGAVRLSDGQGPLVVSEGIETGLSLLSGLLDGPARVWATLSTSGMKSVTLPSGSARLIIATDGDQPGRKAGDALATRAAALGWQVDLMPAPDGKDWNNVLTEKGGAA